MCSTFAGPAGPELAPSTLRYITSPHIAEEYDLFNKGNELFDFDTMLLDRYLTRPGRLIDLGCGTGRHLAHFAGKGFDVTGLDLSEHMLRLASERLEKKGLKADFVHCDMRDLSRFPDESFSYATCMFSTLGMVMGGDARQKIVQEVVRILAPGGMYFVHAHNRWHCWYHADRLVWLLQNVLASLVSRDEIGDLWMDSYRGIPNMYLHIFSAREMRSVLKAAGFSDVKIIYINRPRNGELQGNWFKHVRSNGFIDFGKKRG